MPQVWVLECHRREAGEVEERPNNWTKIQQCAETPREKTNPRLESKKREC